MVWYTQACPVCHGDMHDDEDDAGWVKCFLCARTFAVRNVSGAKRIIDTNTVAFMNAEEIVDVYEEE